MYFLVHQHSEISVNYLNLDIVSLTVIRYLLSVTLSGSDRSTDLASISIASRQVFWHYPILVFPRDFRPKRVVP
ncbi:hypothetical protein RRG08_049821 [Elysia crispata]|uniref:Uncharacterized protein n=1 Tax=Elysia crispata TaxID=231223 RepID=A0AAE1CKE8_9GAST|nr:hypothetical protein RRG08_049821 [Elysia crispata]